MTHASVKSAATALVLGSGGARGAYEVGVAQYLFEDLATELGHPPLIKMFCGTSVGAINACGLAAYADAPLDGVANLVQRWRALQLSEVVRPNRLEGLRFVRSLLGHPPAARALSVSVTVEEDA